MHCPLRTRRGRAARATVLIVTAWWLAACAGGPRLDAPLPAVELDAVPFFPQTDYQCGPAALATVLAYQNLPVTAEDLVPAVYIEGLRGSLQAELLGATRRHGLIPYPIEPSPEALLAEVEAGRPVLVLQNLGLPRVPVWHYAVVVGADPERGRVILRSGEERRRLERSRRFFRSWARAEHWGFVTLTPGTIPATAGPQRYIRALADAEALLTDAQAISAYAAALGRWPDDAVVAFSAANQHLAHNRLEQAATLYRAAIDRDPGHAPARNNLAHVLAAQGCHDAAIEHARAALALTEPDGPLHGPISATVDRLQAFAGEPSAAACR